MLNVTYSGEQPRVAGLPFHVFSGERQPFLYVSGCFHISILIYVFQDAFLQRYIATYYSQIASE